MKKYLSFFKKVVLLSFIILGCIILSFFYYYNERYEWDSVKLQINSMLTISFFIFFFYLLFFLIDFPTYFKAFLWIIIVGTPLWIVIYFLEFLEIEPIFWNWYIIREISVIICIAILSPGLSLSIIKFIKNNSNEKKKNKVFRKYHVHEGFVGILFLLIAFFLLILRYVMIQYEVFKRELRIYLAIDMVLLFLFLFSGSFLIFRDRRDLIKFKFVEMRDKNKKNMASSVFNPISSDSIKFFTSPRYRLFPSAIILNSFSVNLFIHGTDFLPEVIFNINHEILVLLGVISCFIAGTMLGVDWYRLFARLYPNLYQELEQILKKLKN